MTKWEKSYVVSIINYQKEEEKLTLTITIFLINDYDSHLEFKRYNLSQACNMPKISQVNVKPSLEPTFTKVYDEHI